ncbi:MAG: hypothetical protein ACQEWL_01890 [Pseudomonadota bacterium]|uniref:Acid shock protein n=1 Tax=Providencia stuartii TaxID=588 RepID=A0AAI9D8P7_PROST|nr:hypothetical protein [Providencia stuartii]
MKKFLAIVTVLSLAISSSALAASTVKNEQSASTVKTQKSDKVHSASKIKAHTTLEKKVSAEPSKA